MTNPHLAYRPDIDGLRAIAILAIVAFHAFPESVQGGFVGVDIFFVISGYLISGILLRGMAKGGFSFIEFYSRRINRIFPALIVVLSSCLVFGWFALLPDEYKALGKHSAAGAGFLANFVFWKEAGYFDTASELKPLLHLWSLSIEEQFYVLWPAVLFAVYKLRSSLFGSILFLSLCSFYLNVGHIVNDSAASFYSPQTRAWELLMGGALAYLNLHGQNGVIKVTTAANVILATANLKSAFGLALVLFSVFSLDRNHLFPGWWALLPTLGAALMISAGPDAWLNKKLLSRRLLVVIGLISYPLYLWHWPLLSFARIMEYGVPAAAIRIAAVALSFLLAWLTYWLIERRIRLRRHRYLPLALVILLALVAATGYLIEHLDGLAFRTKSLATQLDAFEWASKGLFTRDDCSEALGLPGRCLRSKLPPSVAVLGDSHSTNTFFALERYYGKVGIGVVRLGSGGCPSLYDLEATITGFADNCRKISNKYIDYVLNTSSIKTVVLSFQGPAYIEGPTKLHAPIYHLKFTQAPKLANNLDIFEQALASTISRITQAGKQVIFVMDWPDLGFDPKSCVDIRPLRLTRKTKNPCAIAKSVFEERNRKYREMVARVLKKFPGVKRWDPTRVLCDDQYCWAMKDGTMLYRDANHLSMAGSLYLGERFVLE